MLSGDPPELELGDQKHYLKYIPDDLKQFIISDDNITDLKYPVSTYPKK